MVFYSFLRIIKSALFGLRGVFKYLFYSLLVVAFISICLLLCGSSVFAYEGTAFTEEMINYYTDFIEQHKENYTDYSISRDTSWGNYWVHLYSSPIGNKLYMESLEGMNSTELLSGKWYKFDTNNNWQILADQGTFNNIYFQPTITYSIDHEYYYYGSQPLYASNLTDILWQPYIEPEPEPDPVTNNGFNNVINNLSSTLSFDSFFDILTILMPLLSVVVGFTLGYFFMSLAIKGSSSGKTKM